MENIQWYPGHMTKARRMITENVKLVDIVIEVLDARAPASSRNPDFEDLFKNKRRLIILNSADLSSANFTKKWGEYYRKLGYNVLGFNSTVSSNRKKAIAAIQEVASDLVEKKLTKGIAKTVRAMVVGIPNVGKSSFINCVYGSASTSVGNKPGVTKGKQWVKINPYLELLDTPGMLWPKLENQDAALNLAVLGTIREQIMDTEQLACALLDKLKVLCPNELTARYKKIDIQNSGIELLENVCDSRGFILPGAKIDILRGATTVLDEFRAGRIAKIALELP